jgi:hypothetical protein
VPAELPVPTRPCAKCKEVFPADTEHFYRRASYRDGLAPECKGCMDARTKAWFRANRAYWAAYVRRRRALARA